MARLLSYTIEIRPYNVGEYYYRCSLCCRVFWFFKRTVVIKYPMSVDIGIVEKHWKLLIKNKGEFPFWKVVNSDELKS
jgi:hypothetical protein